MPDVFVAADTTQATQTGGMTYASKQLFTAYVIDRLQPALIGKYAYGRWLSLSMTSLISAEYRPA
jgi:hypothetical protein